MLHGLVDRVTDQHIIDCVHGSSFICDQIFSLVGLWFFLMHSLLQIVTFAAYSVFSVRYCSQHSYTLLSLHAEKVLRAGTLHRAGCMLTDPGTLSSM